MLLEKSKKPQKMDNDELKEIDAEAANAILFNLSNVVIHSIINK